MAEQTVHVEREGRVAVWRLDNPPRNFMNGQMVSELEARVDEVAEDASIGAVVLTGVPEGTFITHYDVREILAGTEGPSVSASMASGALRAVGAASRVPGGEAALRRTPAAGMVALRNIHELFLRMNRMDKVFVAAVNGVALGGGCELALACDIRLMTSDPQARIGLPETALGILPGAGGTQRLARAVGPAAALELILEARPLTPEEAREAGLVHHVVGADQLVEEARSTAERLARRSRASIEGTKRAIYEGASRPLEQGMHIERAAFLAAASTPAAARALGAYAERVDELAGEPNPWAEGAFVEPWSEGTAVDLTSD